jgi:hypothetical protein
VQSCCCAILLSDMRERKCHTAGRVEKLLQPATRCFFYVTFVCAQSFALLRNLFTRSQNEKMQAITFSGRLVAFFAGVLASPRLASPRAHYAHNGILTFHHRIISSEWF